MSAAQARPCIIRMHERDNVAVAVRAIARGEEILPGVVANQDIPQAHKVALTDIPEGGPVLRYGAVIGLARAAIRRGDWVNENSLRLPDPPSLDDMPWGKPAPLLPRAPLRSFEGYADADDGYAGTRNLLGIHSTVQCVAGVVNLAAERIRRELLPPLPACGGRSSSHPRLWLRRGSRRAQRRHPPAHAAQPASPPQLWRRNHGGGPGL